MSETYLNNFNQTHSPSSMKYAPLYEDYTYNPPRLRLSPPNMLEMLGTRISTLFKTGI